MKLKGQFDVGVDVGAQGTSITSYFKKMCPCKRIFAFEPNDFAYKNLIKNYKNDRSVFLTNEGVWDETGERTFYIPTDDKKALRHSHGRIGKREGAVHSQIQAIRLDDFAKKHNIKAYDVVKVDVEGGELKVLDSLGDMMHDVKVIICEVFFDGRRTRWQDLDDYLKKFDFKIWDFEGMSYRKDTGHLYMANAVYVK